MAALGLVAARRQREEQRRIARTRDEGKRAVFTERVHELGARLPVVALGGLGLHLGEDGTPDGEQGSNANPDVFVEMLVCEFGAADSDSHAAAIDALLGIKL